MIGETLYIYDHNARQPATGNHIAVTITGETAKSWLGLFYGREIKIRKDDLKLPQMIGCSDYALTEEGYKARLWRAANERRILDAVRIASTADLQRIDALLSEAHND